MVLKEDFTSEVIAIVNLPTESSTSWRQIFSELKHRGVKSVRIIVSDRLSGLEKVISKEFNKTPHQKCIVHLQRILQAYVRTEDKKELAGNFRLVLTPDDKDYTKEQAYQSLIDFINKWKVKYKQLDRYITNLEWQPYFTYLDYSVKIRRMLYTTNWTERFNRSTRRTLKIRGAFPNEDSALALITSVAIDKSDKTYAYPIINLKFESKLSVKLE